MSETTTWKKLLMASLKERGEYWKDVVSMTLTRKELHAKFYLSYGDSGAYPFLLWTPSRVYFSAEYDGKPHVESVSRDPIEEDEGFK